MAASQNGLDFLYDSRKRIPLKWDQTRWSNIGNPSIEIDILVPDKPFQPTMFPGLYPVRLAKDQTE